MRRLDPHKWCEGDITRIGMREAENGDYVGFEDAEKMERACEAVLLFHSGGAWFTDKQKRWDELTGGRCVSAKVLCDLIREAMAEEDDEHV